MFRSVFLIAVIVLTIQTSSVMAQTATPAPGNTPTVPAKSESDTLKLEREKFDYQKQIEGQKLEVERVKAWATGGSILLPLLLGIITLAWQTYTNNKLKDREAKDLFELKAREAKDTFELKAIEMLFEGNNTVATKNRARALTVLFPGRFPSDFGNAFEPTQFGGPRFEAKLEVFKAACAKVSTAEEVYKIWHALFPGDKWIEPLVP